MTGCLQVGRPLEHDDRDAARDDQLVDHPHRTRHLPHDPSRPADAGEHELPTQDHGMPAGRLRQTVWSARRLTRKLARVAVGSGPAVEPLLGEAPVMSEGSWVGLDAHARSVVAGVIDQGSGEVRSLRVPPGNEGTVAWLKTLPT